MPAHAHARALAGGFGDGDLALLALLVEGCSLPTGALLAMLGEVLNAPPAAPAPPPPRPECVAPSGGAAAGAGGGDEEDAAMAGATEDAAGGAAEAVDDEAAAAPAAEADSLAAAAAAAAEAAAAAAPAASEGCGSSGAHTRHHYSAEAISGALARVAVRERGTRERLTARARAPCALLYSDCARARQVRRALGIAPEAALVAAARAEDTAPAALWRWEARAPRRAHIPLSISPHTHAWGGAVG